MAENRGNPYHDKEGKFTTKDGVSGNTNADLDLDSIVDDFIKENSTEFDPFDADDILASMDLDSESIDSYKEFSTVEEAQEFANKLIGKDVIFYDKSKLTSANTFNKTLFDVNNDFPEAIKKLSCYTNELSKIKEVSIKSDEAYKQYVLGEFNKNSFWSAIPDDSNLKQSKLNEYVVLLKKKNNFTAKSYWYKVNKSHGIEVGSSITGGITNSLLDCIVFNPYNSEEELEKRFSNNLLEGEKSNGIKWTGYHELGHMVSNYLYKVINNDEKGRIIQIFKAARNGNHTTGYGRSSYSEFISEAFADCYIHGEKARSFHKEIFKVIKQLYNKYNGVE